MKLNTLSSYCNQSCFSFSETTIMGNAVQEVKNIADDITLSNEENSVAAYLEKWII